MVTQVQPRLTPITDASEVRRFFHPKIPYAYMAEELVSRVAKTGCLVGGHFELLSGQHTNVFLRFSRFASESANVVAVARAIAQSIRTANISVDGVISPDTAGIILAYELARQLNAPRFVAKTGEGRLPSTLLNHVDLPADAKILLVNDIVTTGRGMQVMRRIVEDRGASVAGAATFTLRKNKSIDPASWLRQGERLFAVADLIVENETFGAPFEHPDRDCPLCTAGVGITLSSELN